MGLASADAGWLGFADVQGEYHLEQSSNPSSSFQ
jgi:hypothetical protein